MSEDVLGLTAQIVSAHVTKNTVPVEELPALIREVYKTLSTVGEAPAPVEALKPAVAVTKSVFPDHIICLEDGKQMTMLKRHLMTEHNLTVDQVPDQVGPALELSDGRAGLRRDPVIAGQEDGTRQAALSSQRSRPARLPRPSVALAAKFQDEIQCRLAAGCWVPPPIDCLNTASVK